MMVDKVPAKWKWLFQPLDRSMRSRLEIGLGVVLTGAAIVGLSTVIRPDPSKLAPAVVDPVGPSSVVERRTEADLRAEAPELPKVAPDFVRAVAHGDVDAMERLHSPGMALDGMLSLAAQSGEIAVARWLLDHGADVHENESASEAPVLVADEHPELAALLLERGAAEPSLAMAAEAGAEGSIVRFLAAHPGKSAANPTDAAPLADALSSTRATAEKKKRIVEDLLAAGADPNHPGGESPVTAAARECSVAADECLRMIKLLVKHGARAKGEALVAALYLDEPARDTILDAVMAAPLERGATAVALAQGGNIPPRVLKRIVAKGVEWSWRDGEDDAALPVLAAVQRGDRDFVRALLDVGAPADVHFKEGKCALGEAIDSSANGGSTDYARIVELLVARGVDVNRRLPDGRTPLFAAAESGELRVVTALLDRGARVNDIVLDDTALDAAEQHGHQPIARVLHARGARRAKSHTTTYVGGL
jgi:ankyrin repeat protein